MRNDRIQRDIENISNKRMLGCVWRVAAVILAAGIVARLIVGQTPDRATHTVVACAFSGLVFGFASSLLAVKPRRFLTISLVFIPTMLAIGLFLGRTIFGWDQELPLRMALAPFAFTACFVAGQVGRRQ